MTTPQLTQYILKPVSSLTFLFVKLDADKKVVGTPTPQNLNNLSYDGLYNFLVLIHKTDPMVFGSMFASRQQLPRVNLDAGIGPAPVAFKTSYSLETLRNSLKVFLKEWFEATVDMQNNGKVNAGVGQPPWFNKNTVQPSLPKEVRTSDMGVTLINADQIDEQHDSIESITKTLKDLTFALQQCSSETEECESAQEQVANLETSIARLRASV